MGNYEQLKQSVSDVIKTNGNQEITGSILQNVLLTIISSVGANATFAGIATPTTNPGTPDGPVFYLASESGTYSNFNAIELQDGLSILMWNGSWSSQQIFGIDNVPTAGSDNLVKSGGIYAKIKAIEDAGYVFVGVATPTTDPGTPDQNVFYLAFESGTYSNFNAIELQDELSVLMWNGSWGTQPILSIDDKPTANSNNLVKSGGIYAKIKAIEDAGYVFAGIATPTTNPGTPDGHVFYLASEGGTYSNFGSVELQDGLSVLMWNGSWSSQKIFGVDEEPTANSHNLVKSGGVAEELALGAVYDVSAKNPTAGINNDGKWESLSALLSDANLNTLIPTAVRKGGMSIKFVQSSDNKYVQYMCKTSTFSIIPTDWEEVANIGEINAISQQIKGIGNFEQYNKGLIDGTTHKPVYTTETYNRHTDFIPIKKGSRIYARLICASGFNTISLYKDRDFDTFIGGVNGTSGALTNYFYETVEDGYLVISAGGPGVDFDKMIFVLVSETEINAAKNIVNTLYVKGHTNVLPLYFPFYADNGEIKITTVNFAGNNYYVNFYGVDFTYLGFSEISGNGTITYQNSIPVGLITVGGAEGTPTDIESTFVSNNGVSNVDSYPQRESVAFVRSGGIFTSQEIIKRERINKNSLAVYYMYGLIDSTTHKPVYTTETYNRHTDFIPVNKGDMIYARLFCTNEFSAISLYSDCDFDTFIDGVDGTREALTNYCYKAKEDGFIVISGGGAGKDFSTFIYWVIKKEDVTIGKELGLPLSIQKSFVGTDYWRFNAKSGVIQMDVDFSGNTYWINFWDESFINIDYKEINASGITTFTSERDVAFISIGGTQNTPIDVDIVISSKETLPIQIKQIQSKLPFYPTKDENSLPFRNLVKVKDLIVSADMPSSDYRSVYAGLGYSVVWDENNSRYVMLMAGYNGTITQVGMSYSTDLENWTDYGVVLAPTGVNGDPDKGGITFPQILKYRDKWIVYYVGFDAQGFEQGNHSICYAITEDFVNFTRCGKILDVQSFIDDGIWDSSKLSTGVIYRPNVINAYGKYYMFINGGPDGDASPGGPYENIYFAESDNPISNWHVKNIVFDPQEIFGSNGYLCSDPDVITNGRDFYMMFWSRGGLYSAYAQANQFPLNWKYLGALKGGMRPLLIPTKDNLYLIINNGAPKTEIWKADWK